MSPATRRTPRRTPRPPTRRAAGTKPASDRGRGPRSRHLVGVLISGRGSNLMAILDRIGSGALDARVAVVLCDEPRAGGIERARARGCDVVVLDHRASASREEHDRRMAAALEEAGVALVCLAGYMRLLSPWFVRRFSGRILNIHPSLLPAFPGLGVQKAALEHGVRWSGCTVHFVDEGLDSGPIILQAPVPVLDGDTVESLTARILEEEHRLYSRAIALYFSGRLRRDGRRILGAGDPSRD